MSGLDARDPLSSKKTNISFQEAIYSEKPKLNIGITDDYNILAAIQKLEKA